MFYQLKAIRKNTKPPVWRRLMIPSNITFSQLAVVLEKMLEMCESDSFEYQFYGKRDRIIEWHGEDKLGCDFYYSYLNAADTYINQWMEQEKSFSFSVKGPSEENAAYRIEIEKNIESFSYLYAGENRKADHPMIIKQRSEIDDPLWSDIHRMNDMLRSTCFLKEEKAAYPPAAAIRRQLVQNQGISVSSECVNRDTHNVKSGVVILREAEELLAQSKTLLERTGYDPQKAASYANHSSQKGSLVRRKYSIEDGLNLYSREELLEIAQEEGLKFTAKRKDKMAYELARYLLEPQTMKDKLLLASEEGLDIFEHIINHGPVGISDDEEQCLIPIFSVDYLLDLSDGTVRAPDDVAAIYNTIRKNGYREFHRKASWLLKCITTSKFIYMDVPLKVLYQMYVLRKGVPSDYQDFLQVLKKIPESYTECLILQDKLVIEAIFKTGAYLQLEANRRNVDFYIPDENEIVSIEENGYPEQEKAYISLYSFFHKEMKYEQEDAGQLCNLAFATFSSGGMMSDFMKVFNETYNAVLDSMEQAQKLASLLMNANNETRMAELKGHKPNEMHKLTSRQPLKSDKKIYPNDPCPCGSGKKYKKCCGRK